MRRLFLVVFLCTLTLFVAPAGWASPGDANIAPATYDQPTPPVVVKVNRCTLYASEMSFGATCGGGASGPALTWRQQLAGHLLVTCHDEVVPAGVALPPEPRDGQPGSYYLQTCVVDFDLDLVGGGPDAHPVTTLVWIGGRERVQSVPPWMDWLWAGFSSVYPTPVLTTGPTAYPRVNVPTFFWLAPASAAPISRVVFDGVQDITITAELVRLDVRPGVFAGEPAIGCGTGVEVYDTRFSPFEQVSACTFTYPRSSASLPDRAYPAKASAFWRVGYTGVGGYRQLGLFDVATVQLLPVQEVQSLVQQ